MSEQITDAEIEELLTPSLFEDEYQHATPDDAPDDTTVREDTVIDSTKLNVPLLVNNIEKYYLNGLINKALYTNKEKLVIVGRDEVKSIYAVIASKRKLFNKELQFGIYDTTNMLNLLGLFSDEVQIDIKDSSFNLSQNEIDVEISLADTSIINQSNYKTPNLDEHIKEYDMELTLTKDIMDKILKSINAFSTSEKNFYFTYKRNRPKLVIGDDASKSNKVNIDITDLGKFKEFDGKLAFFIKYLKHVLSAVKNMDRIIMRVSIAGVLVIEASDENYNCTYFLGADSEQTTIK